MSRRRRKESRWPFYDPRKGRMVGFFEDLGAGLVAAGWGVAKAVGIVVAVLLAVGWLAGCSAHMVSHPGATGMAYAPVNEAQRPGEIVYINGGLPSLVKKRRQDAYVQMHHSCGGSYRIDSEDAYTDAEGVPAMRIKFSCVPLSAAR